MYVYTSSLCILRPFFRRNKAVYQDRFEKFSNEINRLTKVDISSGGQ